MNYQSSQSTHTIYTKFCDGLSGLSHVSETCLAYLISSRSDFIASFRCITVLCDEGDPR